MTFNTILDMYIKLNQPAKALAYFEQITQIIEPNVSTYTIIIGTLHYV